MKILHIEDNKLVIELVKELLKGNEFKSCESFKNIKLDDLKWADLIFLDLKLDPSSIELEGIKVLDIIKKIGLKKKVVILTALASEAKKIKNKYSEIIIGIINKPFLKNDLKKYIKEVKND
jgi:CheY-like chemotaxis protein